MLWCAALVSAVGDLLPDIITAAQEPPTPEAQAKAGKLTVPVCFVAPSHANVTAVQSLLMYAHRRRILATGKWQKEWHSALSQRSLLLYLLLTNERSEELLNMD